MRKNFLSSLALGAVALLAAAWQPQAYAETANKAITVNGGTETSFNRLQIPDEILFESAKGGRTASSITMAAWIRVPESGSQRYIMGHRAEQYNNNNGSMVMHINADGTWGTNCGEDNKAVSPLVNDANESTSITPNEWTYVAMTFNAANQMWSFYQNGELMQSYANEQAWKLFPDHNTFNGIELKTVFFIGNNSPVDIDEVQFFNRALSQDELKKAANAANGMDGLVALYDFNDEPASTGEYPNVATGAAAKTEYNANAYSMTAATNTSFYWATTVNSRVAYAAPRIDGRELAVEEPNVYVTFEAYRQDDGGNHWGKWLHDAETAVRGNSARNGLSTLSGTDDYTLRCVWQVTPGSVEGAYYVQNYVTKKYLVKLQAYNNQVVDEPVNIWFPALTKNGQEGIQICTAATATTSNCLDADNCDQLTGVYGNDNGTLFFKTVLPATTPEELEALFAPEPQGDHTYMVFEARLKNWGGDQFGNWLQDANTPVTVGDTGTTTLIGSDDYTLNCVWELIPTANGAYNIQNVATKKYLMVLGDLPNVSATPVDVYLPYMNVNGKEGIQFSLTETPAAGSVLSVDHGHRWCKTWNGDASENARIGILFFNHLLPAKNLEELEAYMANIPAIVAAYEGRIGEIKSIADSYSTNLPFLKSTIDKKYNNLSGSAKGSMDKYYNYSSVDEAVAAADALVLPALEADILTNLNKDAMNYGWEFKNLAYAEKNEPAYFSSNFNYLAMSYGAYQRRQFFTFANNADLSTVWRFVAPESEEADKYGLVSENTGDKLGTNGSTWLGTGDGMRDNAELSFALSNGDVRVLMNGSALGSIKYVGNRQTLFQCGAADSPENKWQVNRYSAQEVRDRFNSTVTSWGASLYGTAEAAAAEVAKINAINLKDADALAQLTTAGNAAKAAIIAAFNADEEVAEVALHNCGNDGYLYLDGETFTTKGAASENCSWNIVKVEKDNEIIYNLYDIAADRYVTFNAGPTEDETQAAVVKFMLAPNGKLILNPQDYSGRNNIRPLNGFSLNDQNGSLRTAPLDMFNDPTSYWTIGEFVDLVSVFNSRVDEVKAIAEQYPSKFNISGLETIVEESYTELSAAAKAQVETLSMASAAAAVAKADELVLNVIEQRILDEVNKDAANYVWQFRNLAYAENEEPAYFSSNPTYLRSIGAANVYFTFSDNSDLSTLWRFANTDNEGLYQTYAFFNGDRMAAQYANGGGIIGAMGKGLQRDATLRFALNNGDVRINVNDRGLAVEGYRVYDEGEIYQSYYNLGDANSGNNKWAVDRFTAEEARDLYAAMVESWGESLGGTAAVAATAANTIKAVDLTAADALAQITTAGVKANADIVEAFKANHNGGFHIYNYSKEGYLYKDAAFTTKAEAGDDCIWNVLEKNADEPNNKYVLYNVDADAYINFNAGSALEESDAAPVNMYLAPNGKLILNAFDVNEVNARRAGEVYGFGLNEEGNLNRNQLFMFNDPTIYWAIRPAVSREDLVAEMQALIDDYNKLVELYKQSAPVAADVLDLFAGFMMTYTAEDLADMGAEAGREIMAEQVKGIDGCVLSALNAEVENSNWTLYQPIQKGYLSAETKSMKDGAAQAFNYALETSDNTLWTLFKVGEDPETSLIEFIFKSAKGEYIGGGDPAAGRYTTVATEADALHFTVGVKDGYITFPVVNYSEEGYALGLDCQSDPSEIMPLTDGSNGYRWQVVMSTLPEVKTVDLKFTPAEGEVTELGVVTIALATEEAYGINEANYDPIYVTLDGDPCKFFEPSQVVYNAEAKVYEVTLDATAPGKYEMMIPEKFFLGRAVCNAEYTATWTILAKDALELIAADQLENAEIYDLNGRRVYNPATGIYIVNGVKVLIRK